MRNLFKLKNQESQRGVAAVEFAIVLPLLLLLFVGIIEFGIAYYNKQVITNASREGARAAINITPLLDETLIKNITYDYASIKLISSGNLNLSDINVTSSNNFIDREYPDYVTIEIIYTHNLLLPGFLGLGTSIELHAETAMRMF